MRIVTYQPGDLACVEADNEDDFGMGEEVLCQPGCAYTMLDDDEEVIACMGIIKLWAGVAQGWVKVDKQKGPLHAVFLVRMGRFLARQFMADFDLVRLHTPIRAERKEYVRWVKLLGFHLESIMQKAGQNGSDLLMFVMLR